MGEKALSKDKNPSSATHQEDDNPNKTPEPYKCIGNFLTDFTELCKQNGMAVIPPVVTRPKPPVQSSGTTEGKPDKKGDKNKQPVPESKDRPGSVRSMTTQDKSKQKPSAKKKDVKGKDSKEDTKTLKKEKEDTRGNTKRAQPPPQNAGSGRMSSASVAAEAAKTMGKTKDKKKDKGKSSNQEAENMDNHDQINPLLEIADFLDGQLWIAGNRTLINLNLARNSISETGLSALLKAIQYQTTLTLDNRSVGTGLMRLIVNKNAVPPENEVMSKLTEKMLTKDPFYKPPASSEAENA